MADRQRAGITGNATMRVPITGNVNVGGSAIRELRFMPRSAFPEVGRSDVLYIDTLGKCIYYWDGSEYVQLSGGGSGTDNYNALQNRPKINNVTLEGEQTSSDLGLQDEIDDLSSIRSGATAGNTALQPEDVDTLPTDGSSNPVSSGGTYNFVNSSIATNTAYFIGTFASVAELEAYTGTVTNNDYAFVTSTDSAGNTLYNRYKYNAATQTWSFEYAVNNTAFTAAQLAAIQSGMTSADKTKLDGIETGATKTIIDSAPTSGSSNAVSSGGVNTALSGKQDTIADLSDIRSGASAGATAVQPSALNDYQTKLSGTNKLDPSYIDYDASHRAVSDTEKSTWSGKQDTISDLSTIRSGAAAGATAVQPTDMNTALAAKQDTLTFDTVPTENSTNPVTSGGVAASQAAQDAEIAVIANAGAKNLLRNEKNAGATVERQGATWVFDQTSVEAKVSGSVSTTWSDVYLLNSNLDLSDKEYTVVVESDSPNLFIYIPGNTLSGGNIPSNGQYYPGVYKYKGIMATSTRFTAKSASYSNNTIRCMICSAFITDSTYEPYALPNPTLTPAVIKAVDEGAKNFIQVLFTSKATTSTTPSITNNGDGSITINGTRTGGNYIPVYDLESDITSSLSTRYTLPAGKYVATTINRTNATLQVYMHDGTNIMSLAQAASYDVVFEYTEADKQTYPYICFRLNLTGSSSGVTYNNVTIKPMICTAADWAVSQKSVPYCPTNRELYESKLTADGVWGLGTELSANTDLNVVTDIGRYFCTGASVGATLENCPTIQPFVLTVSAFQDVNNKIQRIESLNISTLAVEIYERMKISSGWKSWYKFEGTAVT